VSVVTEVTPIPVFMGIGFLISIWDVVFPAVYNELSVVGLSIKNLLLGKMYFGEVYSFLGGSTSIFEYCIIRVGYHFVSFNFGLDHMIEFGV
jgi:hypothetical protein